MHSRLALLLCLVLSQSCASVRDARPAIPQDIFGVQPGMAAAEAYEHLGAVGALQRKERKRQEVWSVRDDRFDAAIIGLDEEQRIRFITVIAKPEAHIRYADIADPRSADHQSAGQTHTYTWTANGTAKGARKSYYVIAIGGPDFVQYYSLKRSLADTTE